MTVKNRRKGFTLIELLIVSAIISIWCATLMVTLMAPLREQVVADGERLAEGGLTSLFSQLTLEAHAAHRATFATAERRLTLEVGDREVAYTWSAKGDLRRAAARGGSDAQLVPEVVEFTVSPAAEGSALTLVVSAKPGRRDGLPIHRTVTLSLPNTQLEVLP